MKFKGSYRDNKVCDGRTDGRMDGRTDGRTDGYHSYSPPPGQWGTNSEGPQKAYTKKVAGNRTACIAKNGYIGTVSYFISNSTR